MGANTRKPVANNVMPGQFNPRRPPDVTAERNRAAVSEYKEWREQNVTLIESHKQRAPIDDYIVLATEILAEMRTIVDREKRAVILENAAILSFIQMSDPRTTIQAVQAELTHLTRITRRTDPVYAAAISLTYYELMFGAMHRGG